MNGFIDPVAARAAYRQARECRVAAEVSRVHLIASGQSAGSNGINRDDEPPHPYRRRLIVAALGLSLLIWTAVIAAVVQAGIGLHVLAGMFFLVVAVIAVTSITSDVRWALRRVRDRQL